MQQALRLHQEGNLDAAEALYRQILETAPRHPVVLNLLGLIAQAKGLDEPAVSLFSEAIAAAPEVAEYRFNLAWSLQNLRKDAEAIRSYQQALQLAPNTKEAYYALGKIYARGGENYLAENAFNHALALDADYAEAKIELAYLRRDLPALRQLSQNYPQTALAPYYAALLYRNQGDYAAAAQYAEQADSRQADEQIKLLRAEIFRSLRQNEAALACYREALEQNQKSLPALINLANAEIDPQKQEQMYLAALDLDPQNLDAHINYADALYRQKRLAEALEQYRAAVILDPNRPEISNNLGIITRDLGEYEEALGLFFNAFFKAPQNSVYALNLAETLTLLYRQDADTARKIAQNWLRQAPDNAFARHINAALTQGTDIAAADYSRQLFDLFADNYETTMAAIDYHLPELIAAAIAPAAGTIIDLGCGTGLLGAALKNERNRLIGIDISAKMLEKAKVRGIYDQLIEADISQVSLPAADWVAAADVFGYLGDLRPVLTACYPRPLCFSIATGTEKDYVLNEGGRYRHHPQYVRDLLRQIGYCNIREQDVTLRRENNQVVPGKIFIVKEK